MKNKKSSLIKIASVVMGLLLSQLAHAVLPKSAITSMVLPIYGVYTTDDPLCLTNLTATVALKTTPENFDMMKSPTIGAGEIPAGGIKCVVMVVKNDFSSVWSAGTYTGTTSSGGGGSHSDNIAACNNGGSDSHKQICSSSATTWPAKITSDAAAIGLSLTTGTCAGVVTEVVPLFLSTYAKCYGSSDTDASVPGCAGGNSNAWAAPTAADDTAHGIHLSSPAPSGDYTFIVDPTNAFGATGAASCGNNSAPIFSFRNGS